MDELRSYDPTIRDRLAWALSDLFSDRGTRNYVNDRVREGVDFVPVLNSLVGAEESGRDIGSGNYLSGAAGMAMAAPIPGMKVVGKSMLKKGVGDVEKSYLKGTTIDSVPQWIEGYHGTKKSAKFDVPERDRVRGIQGDTGLHITPDPDTAYYYTGVNSAAGEYPKPNGGRIYPVYADPGRILEGMPDLIQWNDPYVASDNAKKFLRDNPNASDEVKGILQSVIEGASVKDAVTSKGYDTVKYTHNAGSYGIAPADAYALFSDRPVVPKFSEEGLAIGKGAKVASANKVFKDPNNEIDWMADFMRGIR